MGKRVAQFRRHRGFRTTAQLADRCEELGHRIEPQVIANMESGRRGNVPGAELAVLAAALEVPVYLLTIPLGSSDPVEVLPGREVHPWTAYRLYADGASWSSVLGGFPTKADRDQGEALLEGADVVEAYRSHDRALLGYLSYSQGARDDPGSQRIAGIAEAHLNALVTARASIRRQGWGLPDLPHLVAAEVQAAERTEQDWLSSELPEVDRPLPVRWAARKRDPEK